MLWSAGHETKVVERAPDERKFEPAYQDCLSTLNLTAHAA